MIRESAKAGVPLCMFASLSELTKGAMTLPDHALCFANREWTVVLVGSSLWGAGLVATAKATGLYEAVSAKKPFLSDNSVPVHTNVIILNIVTLSPLG